MIRTTAGFKQRVVFGLLSATLVTAACSDDDDALVDGGAGKSGSTGVAGKSNNGGNSASGSSSGGSAAAGKTSGGQSSVAGAGGSTSAGTAGTAGTSGSSTSGGEGGNGGEANGGEGGASQPGGGGEGGALSGTAGAGGEAPVFVADVLDNPGFETGTADTGTFPGWTNEGTTDAAFIHYSDAHSGFGRLGHWSKWIDAQTPPYTARTYQTLDPIANGTYSFSMWVDRGWADTQYLFAKGFNAADLDQVVMQDTTDAQTPTTYVKITLSGIVVTSGHVTIGVYSAASAGSYTNFDDAEFTLE